jgi:hypothetical protein
MFVVVVSVLFASLAHAQSAKELAGKYQMEIDQSSVMELRPDGTAVMADEQAKWAVKGNMLTIGPDTVPFRLEGNRLIMAMGPGMEIVWKRMGAPSKASPLQKAAAKAQAATESPETAPAPAAKPGKGKGSAQDEQARQMLMSSAWCSFSYRSTGSNGSGVTNTSRVVFRPDGTMVMGSGSENYSAGWGGAFASQGSNQTAWRWKVENLRLFVDTGNGAGFQDVNLQAYKNSAGYPILKAQGQEFSMCR